MAVMDRIKAKEAAKGVVRDAITAYMQVVMDQHSEGLDSDQVELLATVADTMAKKATGSAQRAAWVVQNTAKGMQAGA